MRRTAKKAAEQVAAKINPKNQPEKEPSVWHPWKSASAKHLRWARQLTIIGRRLSVGSPAPAFELDWLNPEDAAIHSVELESLGRAGAPAQPGQLRRHPGLPHRNAPLGHAARRAAARRGDLHHQHGFAVRAGALGEGGMASSTPCCRRTAARSSGKITGS